MTSNIEQTFQMAIEAHRAGNLQEAESLYRAVINSNQKHPHANHNLGLIAVAVKRTDIALAFFKIAIESAPNYKQFWLSYIDALIFNQQTNLAFKVVAQARSLGFEGVEFDKIDNLITDEPNENVKSFPLAANVDNNSDIHKKTFALRKNPKSKSPPKSNIDKLFKQYHNEEFEKVINLSNSILHQYPDYQLGWKVLGAAYTKLGFFDKALIANEQAIKLNKSDAEAYNNLGTVQQELGQFRDAESSYKFAISLKNDYALAHSNLGNTLQSLEDFTNARDHCIKAISLNPEIPNAHLNLGITLQKLGELEESLKSYKNGILVNPNFPQAYNNIGTVLHKLGRLGDAEDACKKAIALSPNYAEAFNNLGLISHSLGNFAESEASFRRAISLRPSLFEAVSNLTLSLIFQDKLDDAKNLLLQLISSDISNYGLKASVDLAVLNFLDNNFSACNQLLLSSHAILEKKSFEYKAQISYWNYLFKLLNINNFESYYFNNSLRKNNFYVIGESHSLVSHGLTFEFKNQSMQCKSLWIVGCKQWHLASSANNQYKNKFNIIIEALPKNSNILLAIGEIDCRLNHGIIKYCKKNTQTSKLSIVNSTVDSYIEFVKTKANAYGHKLTIQGVPCPNLNSDSINESDLTELAELIKDFNFRLRIKSSENGFGFLDVHTLTDRGDGISNKIWHLDEYHLSPEGMLEAWRNHNLISF